MSNFDPIVAFKKAISSEKLPESISELESKLAENYDLLKKLEIKRLLHFVSEEVKPLIAKVYESNIARDVEFRHRVEIQNIFDKPLNPKDSARVLSLLGYGLVVLDAQPGKGCKSPAELELELNKAYTRVLSMQIEHLVIENDEIAARLIKRAA